MVGPWRKLLTTEILTYNKLITRYCSSQIDPGGEDNKKAKKKSLKTKPKDNKLLNITGEAREKVIQKMMASTNNMPTMVYINNPGDVDFVHSFLLDHVKKVVCSLTRQASKKIFKDEEENLTDRVCCVRKSFEEIVTDLVKSDGAAVKILTKIVEHSNRHNRTLLSSLALHSDTLLTENSLECYSVMPLQYSEMLLEEVHMAVYPPFFKYSEELRLHVTDFEPKFTFTRTKTHRRMDKDLKTRVETIVLLKIVPRSNVLKYLPTKEERYQCIKLFQMKRSMDKSSRLAKVLHDLFPGCLQTLCDHGYYINTRVNEINTAELFYIYLILRDTPGFEDSVLYSQLSMNANDQGIESAEEEKAYEGTYLEEDG